MITFDKLIEEILNKGYQVNKNFKVPKDIPYLKFGFEEINFFGSFECLKLSQLI